MSHMRKSQKTKGHPAQRNAWQGYLFILPAIIPYVIFCLVPVIRTLYLSLTRWDGFTGDPLFIGLANFQDLLDDAVFWGALKHNALWLVMHLVLAGGFGLVLAVLIARLKAGRRFFRAAFFLPHVISLAVVGVIWSMVYDPFFGIINGILGGIGLEFLVSNWLGDPNLVLGSINVASSWQAYGLYMLFVMAGIQNIDPQLYDSAEVDGANGWQQFLNVTLPSLHEVMTLIVSLAVINSFKGFASVWVMSQGGPFYSSELLGTYIYKLAFRFNELGKAAAVSSILGALSIVSTIIYNRWREGVGDS